jgi:hypothetical protein
MLIWISTAFMIYSVLIERSNGFRSTKGKISKYTISALAILSPWPLGISYGSGILMGFWISGFAILSRSYRLGSLILASQICFIAFYQSQLGLAPQVVKGTGGTYQFNLGYFIQLANGGLWPTIISLYIVLTVLIISGLTYGININSLKFNHNFTDSAALTTAILTPAAYSLCFSILTTLSRSSLGVDQSYSGRYNSITYIPIISLLILIITVYKHHFARSAAVTLACIAILIFGPGSIPNRTLSPDFPTWKNSLSTMAFNRERLWQYYICATDQSNIKNYPGSEWCHVNYLNTPLNVFPETPKLFINNKLKLTPGN